MPEALAPSVLAAAALLFGIMAAVWATAVRIHNAGIVDIAWSAQALKSRGEDYREYQRTTSAFFPWFPGGGKGRPG